MTRAIVRTGGAALLGSTVMLAACMATNPLTETLTNTAQALTDTVTSQAVIHAPVPGVETSPGIVDFGILIREARTMLEAVARS